MCGHPIFGSWLTYMMHHDSWYITCSVLKMRLLMPVGISTQSLLSRNLSQKTHSRHDVQDRFATAWRIPNVSLWDWTLDLYNFPILYTLAIFYTHGQRAPALNSLRSVPFRCGDGSRGVMAAPQRAWPTQDGQSMSMSCPLIGPFILAWYNYPLCILMLVIC